MIEDPDPFAIPDPVLARIREVVPHSIPDQARPEDRNEPMPYQRPEGLLPIPGPDDERGFTVTPVVGSTSGTIGSFVGQVSVSPDTLLNDFPAGMDGQTPILRSVSDSTKIYAHATVNGAGVVTARAITAGASVPADDPKTGDFYWELASVTMAAGAGGGAGVPVIDVDQSRWGPIEHLIVNADAATSDDVTLVIENAETPMALRQLRVKDSDSDEDGKKSNDFLTLALASGDKKVEFTLTHVPVNVLVGMRLYGGQLQGQYKRVWVLKSQASDPEWVNLIATAPSATTACP